MDWVNGSERKDRLGGGWPEPSAASLGSMDDGDGSDYESSCISLLAMVLDCGLFADSKFFREFDAGKRLDWRCVFA